jgi:hypothetical protein
MPPAPIAASCIDAPAVSRVTPNVSAGAGVGLARVDDETVLAEYHLAGLDADSQTIACRIAAFALVRAALADLEAAAQATC